MSGDSGVLAISVDGDVVAAGADHGNIRTDHVVGCNIISGDHHDHDNGGGDDHETGDIKANGGGNRWPRQETLALLKIRSDMDAVFRGTNLKGPLWQEVARKLAELGYNRSAKKCKEKFENVYKYHKRTKEGRIEKSEGKTYRFFDQLQAFESTHVRQPKPQAISIAVSTPAGLPAWTSTMISSTPNVSHISTVPLTANPIFISQNAVTPISNSPISPIPAKVPVISSAQTDNPRHVLQGTNMQSGNLFSSTSTSSSTASDQELMKGRYKRKRKWKYFFQRLAKEVIKKQEKLQQEFLETIEKHENERMVREEAWRMQEMARINREHEILVQERSTAAEKDAAVIAFLQKISGQHHPTQAHDKNITTGLLSLPMSRQPLPPPLSVNSSDIHKTNSIENNSLTPDKSSSRWPKTEIQALIRLRTGLDLKYHESGPKAPMWGDISAGMRRLGYNRSAKRCKEKWENINKYFKKVKDSSVKRREDSKTCPYFHELDALYKEKKNKIHSSSSPVNDVKPNSLMEPLMVEPVRQCRPLQEDNYHPQTAAIMGVIDRTENGEKNYDEEDNKVADSDQEEDDHGDGYEMVINKPSLIENVE
ncbi:hypothetical protein F2P56_033699 [Juglans regia]|uniref:Trihelix transcription factor GT-2-like n=2 Tax=Juglans regia TaxID=51240 RepID=A0A2I4H661_JUGRE|nr:trihelix transcription factor GT-2-like [Juglans regia]KAF5444575.1 hypothetical protein F2P56_033699 [Juglans regia]